MNSIKKTEGALLVPNIDFLIKKKGGGEISRRMITRVDAKENLTKENFP